MLNMALLMVLANSSSASDEIASPILDREFQFETNLRLRNLGMPDALMDNWFYDEDSPGANPFPRPNIQAHVIGVEFNIKEDRKSWILYAEYMGSGLTEGYWDDKEIGVTPDHEDGDWVRPDNFSAWFFGGNYGYEIPITPEFKGIQANFMFSGGLGIGYLTGNLAFWHPGSNAITDVDCLSSAPAYLRKDHCEPDGEKDFPRIMPMVDLTLGVKVNFSDRANLRIEGGLHDFLYYGISFGSSY